MQSKGFKRVTMRRLAEKLGTGRRHLDLVEALLALLRPGRDG